MSAAHLLLAPLRRGTGRILETLHFGDELLRGRGGFIGDLGGWGSKGSTGVSQHTTPDNTQ